MKYCIAAIALFITMTPITVFSQEKTADAQRKSALQEGQGIALAPQLSHKKRLFIDKEKRIFLTLKTPVYFRLATSTKDDAPSFLLHSKKNLVKNQQEGTESEALPLRFEAAGRHTFVQPNLGFWNKGMKSQGSTKDINRIFYIYVDESKPVSSIKFSDSPRLRADKMIYGSKLQITVAAKDVGMKHFRPISGLDAGIRKIYYSMNGKPFQEYSKSIGVSKQAEYHFRHYAVDNVGNIEEVRTFLFALDLNPPRTSLAIKNLRQGDILSPKALFVFTSTDNRSGVANIFYQFDKKEKAAPTRYSAKSVTMASLSDGPHVLTYFARDKVKNREPDNKYSFYLDKEPPVNLLEILEDKATIGGKVFLSSRSRLQLTAVDNKAGVKSIKYSFDDKKVENQYSKPIPLPQRTARHRFRFLSLDKTDNISQTQEYDFFLDITSPTTRYQFQGPSVFEQNTHIISRNTKIKLLYSDAGAGIKETKYQLDKEPVKKYSTPMTVAADGEHQLNYFSFDQVNNQEKAKQLKFTVDNVAPQIFVHFSVGRTDTLKTDDTKEEYYVYPKNCMIFVGATDQMAGVDKIWYTINNNRQLYTTPITVSDPGIYRITIQVSDKVRNVTQKQLLFAIK